jgi:hypothetical protein
MLADDSSIVFGQDAAETKGRSEVRQARGFVFR